jgi:DNA-binding IclR family transcriptional regulator
VAGETEAQDPHEARTGAQAVERAIAIVSCFDSDVPDLGLGEIATRTGLRVSTAHRIVRALVRGGLLAQDPRTERYHLGPRLAVLGQSAMARYGLDLVRPQLEDLARVTGEAASLGVRDGDDVVVVLRAESTQPLRFDRPHGARVPLHASAMGKALLAFGGPEPKATVADLGDLTRFTSHTLVRRTDLVADLVTTRERGYSVNREERHDGVCGVGAPVLDAGGTARASVAVQGPSHRFDERRLSELGERVVAAAVAIATELPLPSL